VVSGCFKLVTICLKLHFQLFYFFLFLTQFLLQTNNFVIDDAYFLIMMQLLQLHFFLHLFPFFLFRNVSLLHLF